MAMCVEFYRTADGKCPVESFLGRLAPKDAQKVLWLFRLMELIDRIPPHFLKKLVGTSDIWECRIPIQTGTFRIFGFFTSGNRLTLTHGYLKKTPKTNPREIRRAEAYRRDYLNRHRGRVS